MSDMDATLARLPAAQRAALGHFRRVIAEPAPHAEEGRSYEALVRAIVRERMAELGGQRGH